MTRSEQHEIGVRKGERLTCINGHLIATVAHDIMPGDFVTKDHFEDWQIEPDLKIIGLPRCPVCDSKWTELRPSGFTCLLLNGKWKPG